MSAPPGCRVRVPASSANLGPGFDVLAAALSLHLEVEVVETGCFAVVTDLDVPRNRQNLVVRAFERLLSAERFEFRISSAIPAQRRPRVERGGGRGRFDGCRSDRRAGHGPAVHSR